MRVKICGITRIDQGKAIAQLGADSLGFICFSKSPRYLPPEKIKLIIEKLPPKLNSIGVFVDASLTTVVNTVKIGGLTGVQLHGEESLQFCQDLRKILPEIEIIKAFRVRSLESLTENLATYSSMVDTFLLDAYHPQLPGGTGKTLNWETLSGFTAPKPWLLAGGLTPDNVNIALNQVKPDGIDLSSGVERSPGDKDLVKLVRLFDLLKNL